MILSTAKAAALFTLLFGASTNSAHAVPSFTPVHVEHQVSGKPIGGSDDYTVNTHKSTKIGVVCRFTNRGKRPVDIAVWLDPTTKTHQSNIIHLKAASKKPFRDKQAFTLTTNNDWWCGIYAPKNNHSAWEQCAYLSFSDARLPNHQAFAAVWSKSRRSNKVTYDCKLKDDDNPRVSFFSV